jgi:hypothetical protein
MTRTVHFPEISNAGAYGLIKDREHQSSRVLAKNGRWIVPCDQRPAGWERMRLAESAETRTGTEV